MVELKPVRRCIAHWEYVKSMGPKAPSLNSLLLSIIFSICLFCLKNVFGRPTHRCLVDRASARCPPARLWVAPPHFTSKHPNGFIENMVHSKRSIHSIPIMAMRLRPMGAMGEGCGGGFFWHCPVPDTGSLPKCGQYLASGNLPRNTAVEGKGTPTYSP